MDDPGTYRPAMVAAQDIYQDLLDRSTAALFAMDWEAMVRFVALPFRMATASEQFVIESKEDWISATKKYLETLRSQGVNHYIRLVTDAEFLSENYIAGRHMSYTMCNANAVVDPYENRVTLVRVNGAWRFAEIDSAIRNSHWPITLPKVSDGKLLDWVEEGEIADARRWSTTPKSIYQYYMDALSRSNLENDFDAWCAHCAFPHTVHMSTVDTVVSEPAHIRPFFDMMNELINKHDIDEIDRAADHAEFISATQICGYHTTNMRSKGEVKVGPVSSRYVLQRYGTAWKATSITNSIKNTEFPYSSPELDKAIVSLREIQERTRQK